MKSSILGNGMGGRVAPTPPHPPPDRAMAHVELVNSPHNVARRSAGAHPPEFVHHLSYPLPLRHELPGQSLADHGLLARSSDHRRFNLGAREGVSTFRALHGPAWHMGSVLP
jgi:hypothetical protein